jgi:hypothetical protein
MMGQPERPYSIAPQLREEGERLLERAIAAGAIRCRDCKRVFQSKEEFEYPGDGRVICRQGCSARTSAGKL